MAKKYRVETWHISGIHTGWRVVIGSSGYDKTIKKGFSFDMFIDGDMQRAKAEAYRYCQELNQNDK